MKILIFGNSGSGKSTYAQALATRHGLAHLDLDTIVWEPDQIAVPCGPQAVAASLRAFMEAQPQWVIEGCYGDLVAMALAHCTELVFLNPGLQACQAHNRQRPWEPHKYATAEQQNAMLSALQSWVAGYYQRDDTWSYQAHSHIFDTHPGVKVEHTAVIATEHKAQ
jgi:adenylate kinase family enzyme